jgi:hypothetical protein
MLGYEYNVQPYFLQEFMTPSRSILDGGRLSRMSVRDKLQDGGAPKGTFLAEKCSALKLCHYPALQSGDEFRFLMRALAFSIAISDLLTSECCSRISSDGLRLS